MARQLGTVASSTQRQLPHPLNPLHASPACSLAGHRLELRVAQRKAQQLHGEGKDGLLGGQGRQAPAGRCNSKSRMAMGGEKDSSSGSISSSRNGTAPSHTISGKMGRNGRLEQQSSKKGNRP